MTGPGGREVGRVSVRVVPDTSKFARELRSKLKGFSDKEKIKIKVDFDLDEQGFRDKLNRLRVPTVKVPVDLDTAHLNPKIPVDADTSAATRAVDAEVAKINAKKATIKVDINKTLADLGKNQVAKIKVDVDRPFMQNALARAKADASAFLNREKIKVKVDVDKSKLSTFVSSVISPIAKGLLTATKAATQFGSTLAGAFSDAVGGGKQFGSALASIAGVFAQVGGYGTVIAAAGAAATAAWGFLATGIAALPALLGLVGIPIAALMLGLDEAGKKGFQLNKTMKTAIADISKGMKDLRTALADAFAKGLAPAVANVAKLIPELKTGLVSVADAMGVLATKTTGFLVSSQGIALIKTLLDNVGTAIRGIDLRPLLIGFLSLAGNESALRALVDTINAVGRAIQAISKNTHLDQAFKGLGAVLVSLTQAFGDLVNNGITLFAAAAPGVQNFIDSLAGFFNRFDWTRLGKAVGDVFSGIGDALKNVPPGTIENITSSFEKLGKAFADPSTQQAIARIVQAIPFAIDTVTTFIQVISGIINAIGAVWDFLSTHDPFQAMADAGQAARKKVDEAFRQTGEFFKWLWAHITAGASAAWKWISDAASTAAGWVVSAWNATIGFFVGLWDGIKAAGSAVWTWISNAASTAATWVSTAWTAVGTFFTTLWTTLTTAASTVWTWISTAAQTAATWVTTAWTAVGTFFTTLWTTLSTAATTVWLWIQTAASTAATWVTTAWTAVQTFFITLWTAIQTAASTVWLWISTAATVAATAVTTAWNAVLGFFAGLWAGIQSGVTIAWNAIVTAIQTAWTTIQTVVSTAISAVQTALQSAWDTIKGAVQTAWEAIKAAVVAAWEAIKTAVVTGVNNVITEVRALPGKVTSALGNLGSLLIAAGKALIQGFIDGIKSMIAGVVAAARAVMNAAKGVFPGSPAKEGPFSGKGWTLYRGRALIQGFADGINQMRSTLTSDLVNVMKSAAGATETSPLLDTIAKGLEAGGNQLFAWLESLAHDLANMTIDGPQLSWLDDLAKGNNIPSQISSAITGSLTPAAGDQVAGARPAVVVPVTVNNPVAERSSDSIQKKLRSLALMGAFG